MYVFQITRPGRRIERAHAAAERAALVARIGALRFLVRRDRHVQTAVMQRRRSGDPRERMVVHLARPHDAAGLGVQRVGVRRGVAEVDERAGGAVARTDRNRRAHAARGAERPVNASGLRVERVDRAVLTADVDAAAATVGDDQATDASGKPERPLQREPRDVGGGESRHLARLKARVGDRRAPAGPRDRAAGRVRTRRRRAASGVGAGDIAADLLAGDELGDRAALGSAEARALRTHRAGHQAFDDGLRCAGLERVEDWARASRARRYDRTRSFA